MSEKEPKFVFVILHYQTIDDTTDCVNSITSNVDYTNYEIVIVDNGSPNNSGIILKKLFSEEKNITVILNKENLGFARGNNVGFLFAKENLSAEFIALINNDTIIRQKDFIISIADKYSVDNFHILGPDILSTADGKHQNPREITIQDPDRLKGLINVYTVLLILNYFLLDKILERVKKSIYKKSFVKQIEHEKIDWEEEKLNVKLHGSALIFSPLYLEIYDGLYPKTFMYSEEAIIFFITKRDNLTSLYYPKVQILHKEDSSTESVYKKGYRKRRFYYKNFIKSGKVFLELMEESNRKL